MEKIKFDDSCEFEGTTKEGVVAGLTKWDMECEPCKIGEITCRIHPFNIEYFKKKSGRFYGDILEELLKEFADGGNEEDALVNIYKFYGRDNFDKENTGLLSHTISYMMQVIESYYYDMERGNCAKAGSYREILERDK